MPWFAIIIWWLSVISSSNCCVPQLCCCLIDPKWNSWSSFLIAMMLLLSAGNWFEKLATVFIAAIRIRNYKRSCCRLMLVRCILRILLLDLELMVALAAHDVSTSWGEFTARILLLRRLCGLCRQDTGEDRIFHGGCLDWPWQVTSLHYWWLMMLLTRLHFSIPIAFFLIFSCPLQVNLN